MEGIGGLIRRKQAEPPKKKSGGKSHLPGIEVHETKKERYIHSELHALAAEISAYFGERKKFGVYLGTIKRMGIAQARTVFASIKTEGAQLRDPRKFFMWLSASAGKSQTQAKKAKKPKRPGKSQLDMTKLFR